MYIKRYTIAATIFAVLLGWYVYSFITQDSMSLDLFGVPLPSLSIALWVVVPVVILYIASVFHMSFYSFLGSMRLKKYNKDYDKLVEAIIDGYLGKEKRTHTFKTERYELLGTLLDKTSMFPTEELEATTNNDKLNEVLEVIQKIKSGEVVDLKKFHLEPTNALVIQNDRNRYKAGEMSSEDILSKSGKYDNGLASDAYIDFVKTAPVYAIEQYKSQMSKEALIEILKRVNAEENMLDITNESILSLCSELDLNRDDYILISKEISHQMIPEQRIKLFEMISENDEDGMEALLYTLFDLEMIEPADEILRNSQTQDYQKFKAYRALKECNKHYNIELFI